MGDFLCTSLIWRHKQKHTQNTETPTNKNTQHLEKHLHHRMAQMLSKTAPPGNSRRMRVSQAVAKSCVWVLLIYPRPPETISHNTTNSKQHLFYLLVEKQKQHLPRTPKIYEDQTRSTKGSASMSLQTPLAETEHRNTKPPNENKGAAVSRRMASSIRS